VVNYDSFVTETKTYEPKNLSSVSEQERRFIINKALEHIGECSKRGVAKAVYKDIMNEYIFFRFNHNNLYQNMSYIDITYRNKPISLEYDEMFMYS
jgi:hypothetical protein